MEDGRVSWEGPEEQGGGRREEGRGRREEGGARTGCWVSSCVCVGRVLVCRWVCWCVGVGARGSVFDWVGSGSGSPGCRPCEGPGRAWGVSVVRVGLVTHPSPFTPLTPLPSLFSPLASSSPHRHERAVVARARSRKSFILVYTRSSCMLKVRIEASLSVFELFWARHRWRCRLFRGWPGRAMPWSSRLIIGNTLNGYMVAAAAAGGSFCGERTPFAKPAKL